MAVSDALLTMSAQAKEAEDAFHGAQSSERAKLEEQITPREPQPNRAETHCRIAPTMQDRGFVRSGWTAAPPSGRMSASPA
jgi:hypothetical protein